jgi:hypothetical protein
MGEEACDTWGFLQSHPEWGKERTRMLHAEPNSAVDSVPLHVAIAKEFVAIRSRRCEAYGSHVCEYQANLEALHDHLYVDLHLELPPAGVLALPRGDLDALLQLEQATEAHVDAWIRRHPTDDSLHAFLLPCLRFPWFAPWMPFYCALD